MLNRSAIVVKPRQPFLDWLHAADPTSRDIALPEVAGDPTIYLIPECDSEEDVHEFLRELCEEIFVEQLAGWLTDGELAPRPMFLMNDRGWYRDEETWPQDRSFEVFRRWFEFRHRHHSMLVDLSDEPLIDELD